MTPRLERGASSQLLQTASGTLTFVVKYDNIEFDRWPKPEKPGLFRGLRQTSKISKSFPGRQKRIVGCAYDRGGGRKGRHRQTLAWVQCWCAGDCSYDRGDAFRVVYAVQLGNEIWVIHAFQKKSKQGIKTPKHEIDLVKDRLKRLKEALK
jgi:hypothetical protein